MADEPINPYEVKKKSAVPWCILWFFIGMLIPIGAVGIVLGVVPADTLIGMFYKSDTDTLSDRLKGQSIISILTQMNDLTIGDFPVVQSLVDGYLNDSDVGKYLDIDWTKLNDLKLTSNTLSGDLAQAITFTVTMESLEADGWLTLDPKLKNLSLFSEWVPVEDVVDPTSADFVYGLYYYDLTENDGDPENASYARAFNEDKSYVEGVTAETPLYYVNFYEANLIESFEVLASRLQVEKAIDLVAALSYEIPEDSVIVKLLGDSTIGELAEIDVNEIPLSLVIESTEENQQMRDVIASWMGKEWEDVSLGDLISGDQPITNIKLSVIIDKDDPSTNTQLISIIESMISDTQWEDITIGQLMDSKYSVNNIKLSIFLPDGGEGTNQGFIDVIKSLVNDKEYEDVTLGDLTSDKYSFQNVKISAVMPREDCEPKMITMIESLCRPNTWEELTLADLQGANIDGLLLNSVITDTSSPIFTILLDLVPNETVDTLTIAHLNSIENFDALRLASVITDTDSTIYKVLLDLVPGKTGDTLTLGDLNNITDFNGLHLTTVLAYDDTNPNPIYTILVDLVGNGATANTITVGDLSGITSFNTLHLNSILDPEANDALYGILGDISGKDSTNLTVGDLQGLDSNSFGKILLSRVLPIDANASLYNILVEATQTEAEALTVGDLQNFDIDNVKMTTFMPVTDGNQSFYNLLMDMVEPQVSSVDDLTIASLNTLNVENIHIFHAIDPNSANVQNNAFLRALHDYNPDLKVSEMGAALNTLPLSTVYSGMCWTQNPDSAGVNNDADGNHYVYEMTETKDSAGKTVVTYTNTWTTSNATLSGNQYYISNNAGCWLIFCNDITYDSALADTDLPSGYEKTGRPATLVQDGDFTLSQLESESSQTAYKITHTTLYTLILTGLMTEDTANPYSAKLKKMTIEDMLTIVERFEDLF